MINVVKAILIFFVVCIVSLIGFFFYFTKDCYLFSWPNHQFSYEAWQKSPSNKRYIYIRSLISEEETLGRTMEQVTYLLGEPDYVASNNLYVLYSLRTYPSSGRCGMDMYALLKIQFDRLGRAVSQTVVSD